MSSDEVDPETQEKRPRFGTRLLLDKKNVFEHNAWDNVVWDDVQEDAAKAKVEGNSEILLTSEEIEKLDEDAAAHWDAFYDIHQNKFFKDRNWLFTEFPELACSSPPWKNSKDSSVTVESDCAVANKSDEQCSLSDKELSGSDSERTSTLSHEVDKTAVLDIKSDVKANDELHSLSQEDRLKETFPGEKSKFRIHEVGCGVGNTIFPILKANNSEDIFLYGCDFSSHAIDIVRSSSDYEEKRCFAFVCDISSEEWTTPFPEGSLDVIVCIFVLSALHPSKFSQVVEKMAAYLRPGGLILFRDYGRYDLAQLRFKKGRCLSENFYVRGDGTRCYFFTQEEIRQLMTSAGLEEVQNLVDRRLQVNRGKRITMYRVWVQAKYRKPIAIESTEK